MARRLSDQRIFQFTLMEIGNWVDAECDDIDFAYPTHRFYHNITEGKPGASAPAERDGSQS